MSRDGKVADLINRINSKFYLKVDERSRTRQLCGKHTFVHYFPVFDIFSNADPSDSLSSTRWHGKHTYLSI